MGSETLHAVKVCRELLKYVKKHIGQEDYKRHFTDFIKEEFKKNDQLSDPSSVQNKLKLARDYTFLLNSIHHQKELLFSYNIAVDRTEEMKRTLGKSAASVGLQLPEVYNWRGSLDFDDLAKVYDSPTFSSMDSSWLLLKEDLANVVVQTDCFGVGGLPYLYTQYDIHNRKRRLKESERQIS